MSAVDELVERIDARGLKWHFYRAALGHWCIRIGEDSSRSGAKPGELPGEMRYSSPSLHEALTWAADVRFLPLVPRQPVLRHREVRRSSSSTRRWHVYSDSYFEIALDTKTRAEEYIDAARNREQTAVNSWLVTWGPIVANGTEDVDFRWAS